MTGTANLGSLTIDFFDLLSWSSSRLIGLREGQARRDGSLLDHALFWYRAGSSDGDQPGMMNLPLALVGGGSRLEGGRYLKYPVGAPR